MLVFWNIKSTYSYISYWEADIHAVNKILNKYQNIKGWYYKNHEPFFENIVLPYR